MALFRCRGILFRDKLLRKFEDHLKFQPLLSGEFGGLRRDLNRFQAKFIRNLSLCWLTHFLDCPDRYNVA